MYIRELVIEVWQKSGLYRSRKAKVKDFLKYMDKFPEHCWDECEATFREKYYDIFNDIVAPLLKTDDKLLRLNLIRRLQVKKRRELNLLKTFVQAADSQKDEAELVEVAKLGHKGIVEEIRNHPKLTGKVQQLVQATPAVPKAKPPAASKSRIVPKTKKAKTGRKLGSSQKQDVVNIKKR